MNASRPSEHSPVRGENVETFIKWDHRLCKYAKPLHGIEMGSPMVVTLVWVNSTIPGGGKLTVMLYTLH